jgi:opacity protein-like surface antigen
MMKHFKKALMLAALQISVSHASVPASIPPGLLITGNIGYTDAISQPSQTFKISNYDTDQLSGFHQHHFPIMNISVKKQMTRFNVPAIDSISIGPAIYYQKIRYYGDVWELQSPEYNNYTYDLTSENLPVLVEGDIYFHTPYQFISPFVTAGIGVSIIDFAYADQARINIPDNSELHLAKRNVKFAYNAGAGFKVSIDPHWDCSIRYMYLNSATPNTGTNDTSNIRQPISLRMDSHNILFGITYTS